MKNQSDLEYYMARAAVERAMCAASPEPRAALVHSQLASRYDLLAFALHRPRPVPFIVNDADHDIQRAAAAWTELEMIKQVTVVPHVANGRDPLV